MTKGQDLLDSWIKSQNDFFETWMKSQKNFVSNWTESVTASQKTLNEAVEKQEIPGVDRYYPEYLNWLYSPETINDEFSKNQSLLKATFKNQMKIFKEMIELSINTEPQDDK